MIDTEKTVKEEVKLPTDSIKPPRMGEIVKGKVIEIGRSTVYIDLGAWGTGIIYGREFYISKSTINNLNIGEVIFSKITELENEDGYIELSLKQAGKEITWDDLVQKREKGEIITVRVLGANKGGLLAEISGIRGFLPVSQLSFEHYPRVQEGDPGKILQELQKFLGEDMQVKIFDLDVRSEKLILSEKAVQSSKIKDILSKYKAGDIIEGEITSIADFGAFIKFPALENQTEILEGLIHISELDWQLIDDPSKIVEVGQKVKAKIINIIEDRVFLSLKALKKDPWENIEEKYKKDDEIKGKVSKFNPFGAFIEISPKIQGLCHISEFGTKTKMEESLEVGKNYKFQILEINPKEHRMLLKPVK
ncbi:MAG: S1 RNA-binding domain-containing protein [Candidatus Parcubacteria bacterium]|nr:S1 RNA-binding domain-containing protein [Candidatus Parcubacteria bacterium]